MKKFLTGTAFLTAAAVIVCCFASGCDFIENKTKTYDQKYPENIETQMVPEKPAAGILQYKHDDFLDEYSVGVKEVFDEARMDYDFKIGSAKSAEEDCKKYADEMIASKNYDVIVAVGEKAAEALENSDVPVVFCGVSENKALELAESFEAPKNNFTGVVGRIDLRSRLNIVISIQPNLTNLGVIVMSENDKVSSEMKTLKAECKKLGVNVVEGKAKNEDELSSVCDSVLPRVQALITLEEFNSENVSVILKKAKSEGVPVYGSNFEHVKQGCLSAVLSDCYSLGKRTGESAVSVIETADASRIAVSVSNECEPVFNLTAADDLKLKIPDAYSGSKMYEFENSDSEK